MYLSDFLEDEYTLWQKPCTVVIEAPTGMGKTTYMLEKLLPYALYNDAEILYLTNRQALHKSLIKTICDMQGIPYELMENEVIAEFTGITVMTYQALQAKIGRKMDTDVMSSYEYIVADELHYFVSDSEFSGKVRRAYEFFKRRYNVVKIGITATLDEVSPYILPDSYDDWAPTAKGEVRFVNGTRLQNLVNSRRDMYFIYNIEPRFPSFNVVVYEDLSEIAEIINGDHSTEKWLIFQSNIKKAEEELVNKIEVSQDAKDKLNIEGDGIALLQAEGKKNEAMDHIIRYNCFREKVLVTTKVLDNGISLHDTSITNIVIDSINRTEFIQMLGRRRMEQDEDTVLNLYIPERNRQYFGALIKCNISPDIDFCLLSPGERLEMVIDDYEAYRKLRKFYDVEGNVLKVNQIAKDTLFRRIEEYKETLRELENDEEYFVKKRLSWIGMHNVKSLRYLRLEEKERMVKSFEFILDSYCDIELDKPQQNLFRETCKEYVKYFLPKTRNDKTPVPGQKVIKNAIQEAQLAYIIETKQRKENGKRVTKWVIKHQ